MSPSVTEHLVSFLLVQTQNNYPLPVLSAMHLTKHSQYSSSSSVLLLYGRHCYLPFMLEETEAHTGERSCETLPQGIWQSKDLNPGCCSHKDRVRPTAHHGRLRTLYKLASDPWEPFALLFLLSTGERLRVYTLSLGTGENTPFTHG